MVGRRIDMTTTTKNDGRKVVLYLSTSVDGYTAGPNEDLSWLIPWAGSQEALQMLDEQMRDVDTVLLGRENYQGFSGFWPTVARDPNAPKEIATYARWLDDVEKVVFSRTLEQVSWKNARLASGSLQAEIAALKSKPGRDIFVLSSTRLGQSLLEAGLIDQIRVNVLPVVVGGGRRLFTDKTPRTPLRLVESRALPSGVLVLRYERNPQSPVPA
jgi:dihydrofolate reductase